jgi:hypothetical protein
MEMRMTSGGLDLAVTAARGSLETGSGLGEQLAKKNRKQRMSPSILR